MADFNSAYSSDYIESQIGITYPVTDTSIADHGNPATVGSIAYYIAQINAKATAAERRGLIVIGAGEYSCATKIKVQDNIRLSGSGVGVSFLNFTDNTGGIEANNGDIYTAAATWVVGNYAIPGNSQWAHATRFRCITGGTGGTVADFDTDADLNFIAGNTFTESGGVEWEAIANIVPTIGNFSYNMVNTMTGVGVLAARCNGVILLDFDATGGNTTTPNVAMQIDSCNQFGLGKINFIVEGHGVLFNIEDDTVLPFNFGDGSVGNVDVKLKGASTYGMKMKGSSITTDVINNISINRVEIAGSGNVEDCQVGLWLEGVKRNPTHHIDVELCNVGIMEIGTATNTCSDNSINEFHFLPKTGDQATESYPWARGIPFQVAGASTTSVVIREGWLSFEPFNLLPGGESSKYTAMDDGIWNRDVIAVSAPVAGLVTLTLSGNTPASAGNLNRYPCLPPNTNFTINTSLKFGSSALDGVTQLPGRAIVFGMRAANNYIAPILYENGAGVLELRSERTTAGLLSFHASGGVTLKALSAPPADAEAGMFASSDGTGSGFDGASGAGVYVRNAADSAWVFLG